MKRTICLLAALLTAVSLGSAQESRATMSRDRQRSLGSIRPRHNHRGDQRGAERFRHYEDEQRGPLPGSAVEPPGIPMWSRRVAFGFKKELCGTALSL